MSDSFTRDKLRWIEQVILDPVLTPFAKVVGVTLATRYVNRETGDAWPSHETIASDCCGSTEGVRKAVLQLEQRAHLRVERGRGGRHVTNRYRPRLGAENFPPPGRAIQSDPPTAGAGFSNSEPPTRNQETPNRQQENLQPQLGRIPMKEPIEGVPMKGRAQKSSHRSAESELPSDCPSTPDLIWARNRVLDAGVRLDVDLEAEKFRAHALSSGRRARNWPQAFRQWVLKAIGWQQDREKSVRTTDSKTNRPSGIVWALQGAAE